MGRTDLVVQKTFLGMKGEKIFLVLNHGSMTIVFKTLVMLTYSIFAKDKNHGNSRTFGRNHATPRGGV